MGLASAYATDLREQADRCRTLAALCSLPDIRSELLAMARAYLQKAEAIEGGCRLTSIQPLGGPRGTSRE